MHRHALLCTKKEYTELVDGQAVHPSLEHGHVDHHKVVGEVVVDQVLCSARPWFLQKMTSPPWHSCRFIKRSLFLAILLDLALHFMLFIQLSSVNSFSRCRGDVGPQGNETQRTLGL